MNNSSENKKEEKVKKKFQELSKTENPKSNIWVHCIRAFVIGGLICDVGQFFYNYLEKFGLPKEEIGTWVSIIMIFIGALLTGIGIYDKLGEYAGAGTVVPITGFSNSIVSPAMEFKKEGFIFGVAAKMFTIAGPVLVYGVGSSVIVGIIYYFINYFK
ncbi:stage V sporulation protein AC [Haloimpatiens lingqiaonensis]|uniref:stage V sporulation protein AC n=1 Tax=Haloimpatiens lingqiaonensis TaxID=1380675 RepID=UPI0010FD2628|nr:stage V sporulation protein AC [Haloimpatiens lingqiaonensis]